MKRLMALTVLVLAGAMTIALVQAQSDPTAVRIEKVKENLYVITGGRAAGVAGNTTVFVAGAGHTNGDTVIVFPALQTAVMGDLFARKWAPLIDAGNGGSALAYPQTLAKVVGGIKDVQTVITGHATTTLRSGSNVSYVRSNPVMTWTDLREYADFVREFMAAGEAAMKAGKSVDEAVTGLKLPDRYRDYNMANARTDIQRLYDELNRRR